MTPSDVDKDHITGDGILHKYGQTVHMANALPRMVDVLDQERRPVPWLQSRRMRRFFCAF